MTLSHTLEPALPFLRTRLLAAWQAEFNERGYLAALPARISSHVGSHPSNRARDRAQRDSSKPSPPTVRPHRGIVVSRVSADANWRPKHGAMPAPYQLW
jgi:hypothetical protein